MTIAIIIIIAIIAIVVTAILCINAAYDMGDSDGFDRGFIRGSGSAESYFEPKIENLMEELENQSEYLFNVEEENEALKEELAVAVTKPVAKKKTTKTKKK